MDLQIILGLSTAACLIGSWNTPEPDQKDVYRIAALVYLLLLGFTVHSGV